MSRSGPVPTTTRTVFGCESMVSRAAGPGGLAVRTADAASTQAAKINSTRMLRRRGRPRSSLDRPLQHVVGHRVRHPDIAALHRRPGQIAERDHDDEQRDLEQHQPSVVGEEQRPPTVDAQERLIRPGDRERRDADVGHAGEHRQHVGEFVRLPSRQQGDGEDQQPTDPDAHGQDVERVAGRDQPARVLGRGMTGRRERDRDTDHQQPAELLQPSALGLDPAQQGGEHETQRGQRQQPQRVGQSELGVQRGVDEPAVEDVSQPLAGGVRDPAPAVRPARRAPRPTSRPGRSPGPDGRRVRPARR